MKITNWFIDTKSKEGHSLYMQQAQGTFQRERMEDCLLSWCLETRAAVISGHVTSGLSSLDGFSGLSSADTYYSNTSPYMEHRKEHRRKVEIEINCILTNSSRVVKNSETPSILGYLIKTHNFVKNLMGKPQT